MSHNRQIQPLTSLAFEAMLRHRTEITPDSEVQYQLLMQYKLKKEMSMLLEAIAAADFNFVYELLEDNPQLAVIACGTVTTECGNTYENVTALQLAYLLDDVEICEMMLNFLLQLPQDLQQQAYSQLTKKMAEVESQCTQFKPFDFNPILNAIANDAILAVNIKHNNSQTEQALITFKEYFKAETIRWGKSLIREHLIEAYQVYERCWNSWHGAQLAWFLIHVVGHLQLLVEKCLELECCQGLKHLTGMPQPLNRNAHPFRMHVEEPEKKLSYRGPNVSMLLGKDYFIDIDFGRIQTVAIRRTYHSMDFHLLKLYKNKKKRMKAFIDKLYKLTDKIELNSLTY